MTESNVIDAQFANPASEGLQSRYNKQRMLLNRLKVTLPPEDRLFKQGCPLSAKVAFYDWVIREALEA